MMTFYSNKTLANRFRINLARWKRWSREFLSPDPLGGYQSGYARQYTLKDAFIVFLGGHLVSSLGFSVPMARKILSDLNEWLENNHFFSHVVSGEWKKGNASFHFSTEGEKTIYILKPDDDKPDLIYRIKIVLRSSLTHEDRGDQIQETFQETFLGSKKNGKIWDERGFKMQCLLISQLYRFFLRTLLGNE